jgi:hypothetical protein
MSRSRGNQASGATQHSRQVDRILTQAETLLASGDLTRVVEILQHIETFALDDVAADRWGALKIEAEGRLSSRKRAEDAATLEQEALTASRSLLSQADSSERLQGETRSSTSPATLGPDPLQKELQGQSARICSGPASSYAERDLASSALAKPQSEGSLTLSGAWVPALDEANMPQQTAFRAIEASCYCIGTGRIHIEIEILGQLARAASRLELQSKHIHWGVPLRDGIDDFGDIDSPLEWKNSWQTVSIAEGLRLTVDEELTLALGTPTFLQETHKLTFNWLGGRSPRSVGRPGRLQSCPCPNCSRFTTARTA